MTKTCSRCDREKIVPIQLDDTLDVCGHSFTAQLPAERCECCGQVVIQGHDVRMFELRVAVEIAKATRVIIPKSRTIVSKSMARAAWSRLRAPQASIAAAPTSAAAQSTASRTSSSPR